MPDARPTSIFFITYFARTFPRSTTTIGTQTICHPVPILTRCRRGSPTNWV
ncbi:hypothetical protein X942_5894 [Burkholderia pseudomallei MSHR5596]|nr:hypothetical protein X942_5894 [Burkholderia pseudomallei MSHR5596]